MRGWLDTLLGGVMFAAASVASYAPAVEASYDHLACKVEYTLAVVEGGQPEPCPTFVAPLP